LKKEEEERRKREEEERKKREEELARQRAEEKKRLDEEEGLSKVYMPKRGERLVLRQKYISDIDEVCREIVIVDVCSYS